MSDETLLALLIVGLLFIFVAFMLDMLD